jgi:SAM-dependent methyltransferase
MNEYFCGAKLIGDDYNLEQITKWYTEESEGYANLGSKHIDSYAYEYHSINQLHGFDKIKSASVENALGFGAAWGHEFFPIAHRIKKLTIIEPSDNLRSAEIGHLTPSYCKPNTNGAIDFGNDTFDLITCFGTLHHVPNVSFVVGELIRVLKPNGHLLIREPIVSMGDWRVPRRGLTKNERGIPVAYFDSLLGKYPVQVIAKNYCFTLSNQLQQSIGKVFNKPLHSYKKFVLFDKYLSYLLKGNVHYHATRKLQRIAPHSVFIVIKKKV